MARPPLFDKAMTTVERNRRSRRRRQIFHHAAKRHDMSPVTVYLPDDFIRMLRLLEREDATRVDNADTIAFAALFEWLNAQPEALKAKLEFDRHEHAYNPFELALAEAAQQIDQEGL